ncbi:MAG: preprotein translocase subunit SecE [Rudaea sp.]|uniref:preprotein translocase subunit SecE n=1 Tax=unclassified Rudaea TaxID=2627037 RepID=UPI0010F6293F|nr:MULTISPECIES: preprotein translocase subunit SecE [unclassified Rudaea]MBN8886783.1 preprotein translocase subunit SecE [Rudaea sp.]MBR0347829.1 preprotein translocase subunit SecE [Rudaea sp.]
MNTKVEQVGGNSAADIAKLIVALLILSAAIFAYYWYNEFQSWQRLLILLGGFAASGAIAYFTHSGRATRDFLSESLFELRKVVWPTRQETIQTTLVIFVVVIVLSLILGLIDLLLKWAILDGLLKGG